MIGPMAVFALLGQSHMRPEAKDDVIAFLCDRPLSPAERESWYRAWAGRVKCPVSRTDLRRVRSGSAREMNRSLF